jgi:hypothetical protein
MTTTITVKTHSWPVEATITEHGAGARTEVVDPNSERDFYIHSTCSIGLVELPEPAKAAEPSADAPAGEAAA